MNDAKLIKIEQYKLDHPEINYKDICKKFKIHVSTYYNYKKKNKPTKIKRPYKRKQLPVEIPKQDAPAIVALIGPPDQIAKSVSEIFNR